MAVDFTHYDSNSLLSINKSYQRLESLPLDNSEVIDTLEGLKEYAHNYETAYEGQIVYCKEDKNPYIYGSFYTIFGDYFPYHSLWNYIGIIIITGPYL